MEPLQQSLERLVQHKVQIVIRCSKEDVIKATNGLQKKIHPDVNLNSNTERLSQIVNEAKETIVKLDFN